MTITADTLRTSLNVNVAARSAYEADKNNAEKITAQLVRMFKLDHKTLESQLSDRFFERLAETRALSSFDFINDAVKSDQRFNIKAIAKVAAKLRCIADDRISRADSVDNKFCIAAALTVLQHRDNAEFSFTRKHALAMLSKSLRFETVRVRDLATKFDVSESTASTQVSSSFRTLEALDVLRFDDSERARSRVSNVNLDHAFIALVRRDMLNETD